MALPADYHMHTPLCRHATGEPTDYAARAEAIGLTEIGFSDHSPMERDDFDDWRMRADQLDAYVEKVRQARQEHPELTIRLALEIDYLPGHEEWIAHLAAKHSWDYLIGSVHYVSDDWALDNPEQLSEWRRRAPYEVWSAYFERLTQATESGLFDIIGHADLCKKFGFYPDREVDPLYHGFIEAAARQGVAIEINTAGLRKPCHEFYPHPELLRLASNAGVALTFGSDAHAPAEVGKDFAGAVEVARECGYRHYCGFTRRHREVRSLPHPG